MKRLLFICICTFFSWSNLVYTQQVTINDGVSAQQFVEELVEGCIEISNVSSSINGSVNGLSSFGTFTSGSSNFPFQNGVVLSTGNVTSGGNAVNTNDLNEGDLSWGTDPDLAALGLPNMVNATSIEFDFISATNQIQFNYILASEEYLQTEYICDNLDSFVFLIRETASTAPYTNVAVVGGSRVSPGNIHPEIFGFCNPENESSFGGYSIGDTNFDGRTTILTSGTSITPYTQYHVKLIIADGPINTNLEDSNFDSAVFIQGNSLTPDINLGDDITTCAASVNLNAEIGNSQAIYNWYFDGTLVIEDGASNFNVVSSGTYTVEIVLPLGSGSCTIEDEIVITLANEQTASSIDDFSLCDLNVDGSEFFDLTLLNQDAIDAVSSGSYTISYHLNLNDAENNNSPITSITSSGQTIFIRIQEISGCLAFAPVNLVVIDIPTIPTLNPFIVCVDESANGIATIELSSYNSDITLDQTGLQVTYHNNEPDALSGNNPLSSPFTNTTQSTTLYASLIDTTTQCRNSTPITIEVSTNPIINTDPIFLDACDSEHDGFASFNFTDTIDDVLQGLTGATVTFYTSQEDANTPINEIPDITNFTNTSEDEQSIFVRVQDDVSGCYTVRSFEIHTNLLLSETANIQPAIPFTACDEDNDGSETFNLETIEGVIANNLPDVTVSFFETQEDQTSNTNALDNTIPITVDSLGSSLFITINNGACTELAEISFEISPVIGFPQVLNQTYCDTDSDGFTEIDLSSFDDVITSMDPDFQVIYFANQVDASNNVNPLPNLYTNTSNPLQVFIRIQESLTGCADIQNFLITVNPAPNTNNPSDLLICDNDQDGFSLINLRDQISSFYTGSLADVTIDFFETQQEAIDNNNPIPNQTNYNTDTHTVYGRITNTNNCFRTETLNIIINTLPILPATIPNYQECVDGTSTTADFIFSTQDETILNGADPTIKQVLYFEDAARTLLIDKDVAYLNTTSPQTIYIRIENITDTNCFALAEFNINIAPNPVYNIPQPIVECDDAVINGFIEVNFNATISEMTQGITNPPAITFFLSQSDAENEVDALPLNYTNTVNPQPIFIRIQSNIQCVVYEEIGINVLDAPELSQGSQIIDCDVNYDGEINFDLTDNEVEIFDVRQTNLEANYFLDAALLNEILIPESFNNSSNPQTIYLAVTNTITQCVSTVPIELIINLPPQTSTSSSYAICDTTDDMYTLSNLNSLLVDDLNTVNISYYGNMIDAENGDNSLELSSPYNYQSNNDLIFVRIEDRATTCHIVNSFNLRVNANPVLNIPSPLEFCDDNTDEMLVVNLSDINTTLIGSTTDFIFSYYTNRDDALSELNEISDFANYTATNEELIFVNVKSNITGCFTIASFNVLIHPLPIIDIPDFVPFCDDTQPLIINANTNNLAGSYSWINTDTNIEIATTPELSLDITELGNYSVTITSEFGCITTDTFTVINSEEALIEFTTTVDFSNPNSITVNISGNGDYVFILDNGPEQQSNFFNNVTPGLHTVTVRDLNGCTDVQQEVFVIDVPLFITPNEDGYFDTWHIIGKEQLPGTLVYIFDRYGKLLKTLTHNSPGWNGTFNGQNMPTNDYWFLAKVQKDGLAFDVQGHFTLKR